MELCPNIPYKLLISPGALVSASGADRILNALESASLETLYISYVDPETIDDSVRDKNHLVP